eukprot:CAMPEP_0114505974 /NCGR_PEP_ID=MMETSP0109-20121206/11158_1 /TAXON_ID=29199 /ORGANISM="Chlorarachnion reptans, Strain CCCM449" /LENGTH=608 /DNA_ID=CAMNT_0001684487 /DNA_START=1607 /DNA_END=3433 /DNA_ORIENTATION=+
MPIFRDVEVVDPDGGDSPCYYEAKIHDFKGGQLLVSYQNNWRDPKWMDASEVRKCAPQTRNDFSPNAQDPVEVKARQGEDEPYGWWKAKILAKSTSDTGTLYMVHFEGWDDYDDVVGTEDVRPRNPNKNFSEIKLDKFEIQVPKALREPSNLDYALDKDMRHPSTLYSIYTKAVGDENNKTYYIVCIGEAATVKKARLLAKMTFKHQLEKQALVKGVSEAQKRLQIQKNKLSSCKVLKLPILDGMTGWVIGKKGSHIKKALKIKGVESVKVDDKEQQIIIVAETMEAAREAQELLEIVKSIFPIPSEMFGRFVGTGFKNIEEIKQESEVMQIRAARKERMLDSKNSNEDDAWAPGNEDDDWADSIEPSVKSVIDLEIVGNPSKVEAARMMLSVRMKHIEESLDILHSRRSIYQQMDNLQSEYGIQGGRGGRGGARGGRRGRRSGGRATGGRGAGGRGAGGRGAGGRNKKSTETPKDTPKDTDEGEAAKTEPTPRSKTRRRRRRNRGSKSAAAESKNVNETNERKHEESKQQTNKKGPEKSETAESATKIDSKPQRKNTRRRNKKRSQDTSQKTQNTKGIEAKESGSNQEKNTKQSSEAISDAPKEAQH